MAMVLRIPQWRNKGPRLEYDQNRRIQTTDIVRFYFKKRYDGINQRLKIRYFTKKLSRAQLSSRNKGTAVLVALLFHIMKKLFMTKSVRKGLTNIY